ncbi:hypothetical protein DXT93_32440 [Agrobacterium rhizogenes]|nr:hypothetical protein [Rhizobium rhizogenes]
MSALIARSSTAGHDEFRDADRLINFALSTATASDELIGVEVSSLKFIMLWHFATLSQRRDARNSVSKQSPGLLLVDKLLL